MSFSQVSFILYLICFVYCALSVLYLFILSFAARWFRFRAKMSQAGEPENRIAILVPAYKEDGIILSTAHNLLSLDYPVELYTIYIIADSFRKETIEELRKLRLGVIEVSFEKSTKTKSLNEAFKQIPGDYDIALICDADNMLANDFLRRIDNAFVHGARAVQGRRVAKNHPGCMQ
jgi:cellulose synthase/poly-beta-1,6-N-acetylglucosamine synthase-like glycosyltransferase